MNVDQAKEITHLWCTTFRKIEAIKILRSDTNLGLKTAKDYLDGCGDNSDVMFKKLCDDFVKDPKELLVEARAELRRQLVYIQDLERQIGEQPASDALMAVLSNRPGAVLRVGELVDDMTDSVGLTE